jgi:hypothetical protein
MSVAFLERSIQLINGKILNVYNQLSSALGVVTGQISSIDARVTALEGVVVPTSANATFSLTLSAVHTQDEASIWTDGNNGTIVRLQGDNNGFSTLALPTVTAGKYYVLTNISPTSNHFITISAGATPIFVLEPLETATFVYDGTVWTGLMGVVPNVSVTLS